MKVIAYCRVSTEKQDLDRQRMLAKDYCKVRGYELVDTIVEKQSGAKSERDGLSKLLSLTSEQCDLVVVSELSRISREEEFQRIFHKIDILRDNGISVVFLDDPDNVYSKENPITFVQFIMLGVKAQGAREELLKIRDRMKSGRESKLKVNPMMVTTSQVPFGYEKYDNPDYIKSVTPKSLLRVKESERLAVRFCYDMACSGKSCQRIADWLNANGYEHNNNKGKKLWQAAEVARMLRNRLYIGERTVEGITHSIEPFVSLEVFEMAGRCISHNRCIIAKEEHFNPLKGLLFCGHCGLPMSLRMHHQQYLNYQCLYSTYRGRNPNKEYKRCNNNTARFEQINDLIFENINGLLQSDSYYGQSELTLQDYKKQLHSVKNDVRAKIVTLRDTQLDIQKAMKQLDVVTEPFLIQLIEEKLVSLRKQLKHQEEEIKKQDDYCDELLAKIVELENVTPLNKEMTLYERAEFFHKVLERIEWNGVKFKRYGILTIYTKIGCILRIAVNYKEPPEGFGCNYKPNPNAIIEDGLDID